MLTEVNFKELLKKVRCFVFDVDGVLTDGSLLIQPDGSMFRTMNIKDGYAIQLAAKKGYFIFVISGSTPEGVAKRLERLGIDEVHIGIENKLSKLENLLLKHRISAGEVLYMGDDMPDLEVLKHCGIRTCPSDAVHQIREVCHYISMIPGGKGCVRDVIEQVLQLKGDWQ
ncbi:MAG: HAD hydrolase family protein [Bacteroidia bacterium]|nr:HAD hydrolase family protein [Bacteroidia bacterium]